jgi:enamine deaminase RidA (YjgF/YER057c/UK114 family)
MPERVESPSPYEARYGFCRAIRVGDRVEVAGTAPIDPDGGPSPASAYDQMLLCAAIAEKALLSLGASIAGVVRTRMYLVDPADADEVGRAHREAFGAAAPAATMVIVAGLLDPAWRVELEVSAVAGP